MTQLPFAGIRVIEFTHMVMGPTCGMVLADLGAEVIKIEPLAGDNTRHLLGSGAGFFAMFNRNKKSVALDLQTPAGLEAAHKLIATADIVIENFKPGAMAKLGLDYANLSRLNERLIYVSHKGFLPGPYDHRTALDEVVQMMGGLAYMTGRPGDPLRAGSSVNDIMGGMFGAIGAMAALVQRAVTGKGQQVQSGLFENNVFLMAQHMMQFAVTGQAAAPMPSRISAWAVYDVFTVKGDQQIFLAVDLNGGTPPVADVLRLWPTCCGCGQRGVSTAKRARSGRACRCACGCAVPAPWPSWTWATTRASGPATKRWAAGVASRTVARRKSCTNEKPGGV